MKADRRALLLAAPAVLLGGCGTGKGSGGSQADPIDRGTQRQGDLDLLGDMLRIETRQIGFYDRARKRLGGERRALAERLLHQERVHFDRLERAVSDLGGKVAAAVPDPRAGQLDLEHAAEVEGRAVASYLDWMPKLSDGRLRRLVASIAAVEAEHLAVIRGELGRPQVPDAFVT